MQTKPAAAWTQWLETSRVGGSLAPLVHALHSLTAFPSYANAEVALRCWPQLLAHKPLGPHTQCALQAALPELLALCASLASPKVREIVQKHRYSQIKPVHTLHGLRHCNTFGARAVSAYLILWEV